MIYSLFLNFACRKGCGWQAFLDALRLPGGGRVSRTPDYKKDALLESGPDVVKIGCWNFLLSQECQIVGRGICHAKCMLIRSPLQTGGDCKTFYNGLGKLGC